MWVGTAGVHDAAEMEGVHSSGAKLCPGPPVMPGLRHSALGASKQVASLGGEHPKLRGRPVGRLHASRGQGDWLAAALPSELGPAPPDSYTHELAPGWDSKGKHPLISTCTVEPGSPKPEGTDREQCRTCQGKVPPALFSASDSLSQTLH